MTRAITAASWIALSILTLRGQAKMDLAGFEVASVKRAAPADDRMTKMRAMMGPLAEQFGFSGGPGTKDPGRIRYSGVSLKMLLVRAYHVRPYQISGPEWLDTERYDIEAKLPPGTDGDLLRAMLQKLLTERFQISLHRDMKELPVYRLTVAKNGPKLKAAEKTPENMDPAAARAALQARTAALMAAAKNDGTPWQSMWMGSATVAEFARNLESRLDRPVKDLTGLDGSYSFSLRWAPDSASPLPVGMPMGGEGGPAGVAVPSGPSIFTAVQEQLGLKLEAARESIEFLVIDKVEKVPVSN
jgi:uncharacterized protein (TIGR03435 family)